ncbi:hypothetical protein AGMMS49992_22570 [Clostridia bacterium]|nr:hypothetical protein AGMMS49992_22570 [Clostridia bacterium]
MENGNVFGKIVEFITGFIKKDGTTSGAALPDLSSIKLPDAITHGQFGELISLLKGFLGSGEGKAVEINTRNHLSAAVTEAEKAGVSVGWVKIKELITDKRAQEFIQPLLGYAVKNQEQFGSVIQLFVGGKQ